LVHITSLKADYYHFEPNHHMLQGERTGRVYRLGDRIRVRVTRVDLDERKIDFEPLEDRGGRTRGPGRRSGKRRR
jgi:ribonuclease R